MLVPKTEQNPDNNCKHPGYGTQYGCSLKYQIGGQEDALVRILTSILLSLCIALGTQAQTAPTESNNAQGVAARPQPQVLQAMPSANAGKPVLEDGTPVKLRLSRNLSSADAHVGDTVDFEVLEEIKVGDLVVIPKGGVAWGTVTEAQAKRRMARGGKLGVNIDSVRLTDGEKVALRAVKEGKGGGHTGAMTGAMVATAIVFFPAAPLFLFMHGKDITIPKGTEITAYIEGNAPLDIARFAPPIMAEPAAASSTQATMRIESTPPGADVELDGAFAGDTPSEVGVAAGEHSVRVTKSGYKAWERKIRISTGTVKVTAELEKAEAAPAPAEAK